MYVTPFSWAYAYTVYVMGSENIFFWVLVFDRRAPGIRPRSSAPIDRSRPATESHVEATCPSDTCRPPRRLADRPIDRAVVVERSIGVRRRVMRGRVRASSLDAVLVIEARVVRPFTRAVRARNVGARARSRARATRRWAKEATESDDANRASTTDVRARGRADASEAV